MSNKREGPKLQMQDVRLACGELNERERVAVQWTLDRHNEIVGSMVGPSDVEIEREVDRLAEESTAPDKETPNWMKADIRRGIRRGIELARAHGLSANPMAWMNEHGEVIRDGVRGMVGYSVLTYNIPLYRRDHFPRSPKVEDKEGETCSVCSRKYQTVFKLDANTWSVISGRTDGGGLICPSCSDRLAREKGIELYWSAATSDYPGSPKVEDEPVAWMREDGSPISCEMKAALHPLNAQMFHVPLYRYPADASLRGEGSSPA